MIKNIKITGASIVKAINLVAILGFVVGAFLPVVDMDLLGNQNYFEIWSDAKYFIPIYALILIYLNFSYKLFGLSFMSFVLLFLLAAKKVYIENKILTSTQEMENFIKPITLDNNDYLSTYLWSTAEFSQGYQVMITFLVYLFLFNMAMKIVPYLQSLKITKTVRS